MSKQNEAIQQLPQQRQQVIRIWKELNQVEDNVDVYTSRKIGKAMLDLKTAARHLQDAINESNVDSNGKSFSKEPQREFASS